MNKEIKFRVWNKLEKKMSFLKLGEAFNVTDNDVVMQFVDMLDKNEKEIYEGDIILNVSQDGSYDWKEVAEDIKELVRIARTSKLREVVGNIYENPELRKEKEKITELTTEDLKEQEDVDDDDEYG